MQHIEKAGIHSGDSACSLPPFSLSKPLIEEIKIQTEALAKELNVIGLLNIQFAIKDEEIFILEVNPRASRTVPFVSKAIGRPLAKLAAQVMAGKSLKELGFTKEIVPEYISIKESVFPFIKFSNVDVLLGPEMKSTGEVMGIDVSFGRAFAKAQIAAGSNIPEKGRAFISVKDEDKPAALAIAQKLSEMNFDLVATKGTANYLSKAGLKVASINKFKEGAPHIVGAIEKGETDLVINTVFGPQAIEDSFTLRRASLTHNLPYYTTIAGAEAMLEALKETRNDPLTVTSLQERLGLI
jgi:carbamoyl-phosphate synthase large subunit